MHHYPRLTSNSNYELQVDMWDWKDAYAVAKYGHFQIHRQPVGVIGTGYKLGIAISLLIPTGQE